MIGRILLMLTVLWGFDIAGAQETESACGEPESKKGKELLEKIRNKKKYEFNERQKFVKAALEEEPECAAIQYEAALMQVTLAVGNGTSYKPAYKYFEKALQICPDNYPLGNYYCGLIAYGDEQYEKAANYLEKYLKNPGEKPKDSDYKKAEEAAVNARFFHQMFSKKVDFNPVLIKPVSTHEDEFLPMLSPDNSMLLYTRRFMKQGKDLVFPVQTEELTLSKKDQNAFTAPQRMEPPFNTGDNYGGVTFSLDNTIMYITICKPNKTGGVNCDLYSSSYGRDGWTKFQNLGPNVNTEDGWEAQPSLSSDGKTIYFASARAGSQGMDIYRAKKSAAGEWLPAERLGPEINTDKNEKSPFIHSDSQTLYFSSDGKKGMGGYDIFFAKGKDTLGWGEAKNIGYPINTENDEVGFFVSLDGRLGYFSSNKIKANGGGGWDIFSFDLYKDARPEKVLFVKGKVESSEGDLPTGTSIKIKTLKTNTTHLIDVDSVSGNYAAVIAVKDNEDAYLSISRKGYAFEGQLIKQTPETSGQPVEISRQITPAVQGKTYPMNDILYKTNSAELEESSKVILDAFAEYLIENETLKLEIHGHTDNTGNSVANKALSADRAFTVMDYLISKGVPKKKLDFKGFGDSKPITSNNTPEGRAKNRRTEFYVR